MAAGDIPTVRGSGKTASPRVVLHPDLAMDIDSEKPFRLNEDACCLVLRVTSQGTIQPWARSRLCRCLHSDRASGGATGLSGHLVRAGGPGRRWVSVWHRCLAGADLHRGEAHAPRLQVFNRRPIAPSRQNGSPGAVLATGNPTEFSGDIFDCAA